MQQLKRKGDQSQIKRYKIREIQMKLHFVGTKTTEIIEKLMGQKKYDVNHRKMHILRM
jgi:hypothetical protein